MAGFLCLFWTLALANKKAKAPKTNEIEQTQNTNGGKTADNNSMEVTDTPVQTGEVQEFSIDSSYSKNAKLSTYKNTYGYSIKYLSELGDDKYMWDKCEWKAPSDGFFGEDNEPQNLDNPNDDSFRLVTDCDNSYIDIFVATDRYFDLINKGVRKNSEPLTASNFINKEASKKVSFKGKDAYISERSYGNDKTQNVITLTHKGNPIEITYTEDSNALNVLNSIEFID
jgi:hypothetical protein